MMRLGRPEHPPSKKQDTPSDQTVITEETVGEEPKAGRSTLLRRLKMLWSHNKEKHDSSDDSND